MPLPMLSSKAAKVIIEPRIGPIQGVQPNPKAAPTINGKAKLLLYWPVKNLMSLFMKFKLIIPIIWSEKNTIIIPATILKIFEFVKKNFPIEDAVEPNAVKTKENPNVKKIVLKILNFFLFLLFYLKMFLKYKKYIQELMEEHMVIKN